MTSPSHTSHSHVGRYLAVFGALMVLTGLTVGVSYLHLTWLTAIIVALIIASVKGGLVAAYFMHLVGEHKVVFMVLALTLVFLVVMLAVPTLVLWGDYQVR